MLLPCSVLCGQSWTLRCTTSAQSAEPIGSGSGSNFTRPPATRSEHGLGSVHGEVLTPYSLGIAAA